MLQVFPRWMLSVSIKLCSTKWCFILQTSFFSAFQGERQLHSCTQVCLHEAPNNTGSRFLNILPRHTCSICTGLLCSECLSLFFLLCSNKLGDLWHTYMPCGLKFLPFWVLCHCCLSILGMFIIPDLAADLLFKCQCWWWLSTRSTQ